MKKLNKSFGDLGGLVINSDFNKSTYKQIKVIDDIPLTILLNNQQIADTELDRVINERVERLIRQ